MKIYKKILGFFALAVLLNPNTLTLDASTFSKEDQIQNKEILYDITAFTTEKNTLNLIINQLFKEDNTLFKDAYFLNTTENTTFKNCTGLPIEGHLSTAYDISIMSRELLKHPTILKYTGTYMETISEGRKSPIELVNHNKLVRFFKGCDGLKTGFTNDAKYCISATATRDGVRMLSVIMGAPTFKIRNRDASMLMNYGFSKFESKQVATKDGEVEQIPMSQTGDKFIIGKAKDDLTLVCPKGMSDKIEKKVVLDESKKKIKEFDTIGYCEYYLDGELLGKVELYSDRDMKKGGIIDSVKFKVKNFFNGEEEDKVEEKTEEKSNEK